tara:strand:+ start:391 stop:567 length:177 start_codon:yes stop_codon:yes gene_type:complete
MNNEVKNIKIIGTKFMANKNNNFLSFKLNLILNLEITNIHIIKKGIKIPICFPKNIKG